MDPQSPSRSKILQWLPVDSSINSHWHSTLISIFIIHALAVTPSTTHPANSIYSCHLNFLPSCLAYAIPSTCNPTLPILSVYI